jgi:hypothetical protein
MMQILSALWARYCRVILLAAIGYMLVAAFVRLRSEGERLLFERGRSGAVDLLLRYGEVQKWFAGERVYVDTVHGGYPPASYAILFPFLSWLDPIGVRWFWGFVNLGILIGFTYLLMSASYSETKLSCTFIFLLPFSIYPTPITLGNGQLGTLVLPALAATFALISLSQDNPGRDALCAFLLLIASVKPNLAAPFFLLVLARPGGWRPMVFFSLAYLALTFAAAAFQPEPLWKLLSDWVDLSRQVTLSEPGLHLPHWFVMLGKADWVTPLTSVGLASWGIWVWLYRERDIWLLAGVGAIVTRLLFYHHIYDDMLILFPMLALWRVALSGNATSVTKWIAGGLLGMTWLGMQAPGGLQFWAYPWSLLYEIGQPVIWLMDLFFLAVILNRPRDSHVHGSIQLPSRGVSRAALDDRS